MANFSRIFISGSLLDDGAPGTARLADFLQTHPDALVLDEHPYANISGYASTVADEISLILEPLCLTRAEMAARIQNCAQQLNITELLGQNPLALSGGQTQLVALASLLVGESRPLVLHSLLQGLDTDMRERVLAVLDAWQADLLWTNPARPFPEEAEHATEILIDPTCTPLQDTASLSWELQPAELTVEDLTISPKSSYRGKKRRLFKATECLDPLLAPLNLLLESGSFLLIQGRNGAGKTTLARTIAGLIQPVTGQVHIGADDVHRLTGQQRVERVALVGQHPQHRIISPTVAKDLLLGPAAGANRQLYEDLLGASCLTEFTQTHPHDLTLGQQTFLSIINALLTQPSLLILDEPTAHLNQKQANRLRAVLASYRAAGGTIICISHDDFFAREKDARYLTSVFK